VGGGRWEDQVAHGYSEPGCGSASNICLAFPGLTRPRSQLNPIAQVAYSVLSVIPQVCLMVSLFEQYAYLMPGTHKSVPT
jgi:hypothetical protein